MLVLAGLMMAALMGRPEFVSDLKDSNDSGVVFVDKSPRKDDGSLSLSIRFHRGEVVWASSSRHRVIDFDWPQARVDPQPSDYSFLYPIGSLWATLMGHTVWVYDLRYDGAAGDIVVDTTPHRDDRSLSLHIHLTRHLKVTRIWTNRHTVIPRDCQCIHRHPIRIDP